MCPQATCCCCRYDMSSYVQAELAQLQSRILALQTQKQALSKSAQSKRSHSALCGTQSTANNATAPAGDALGRCTSNHCSLSDANAEQSKIDRNNTSFLFIGVLSVAANAGQIAAATPPTVLCDKAYTHSLLGIHSMYHVWYMYHVWMQQLMLPCMSTDVLPQGSPASAMASQLD